MPAAFRPATTGSAVVRQLVVPHGYTLSVGGSLAILLEFHPRPGPLAIWLFVAGAAAGFAMAVCASRAYRAGASIPSAAGRQLFNLSAIAIVPVVGFAVWWIPGRLPAFLAAGVACSCSYIAVVTLLFHRTARAT